MLEHVSRQPSEATVTERRAALFRDGRNQTVRIPRELEMEGSEVLIRNPHGTLAQQLTALDPDAACSARARRRSRSGCTRCRRH